MARTDPADAVHAARILRPPDIRLSPARTGTQAFFRDVRRRLTFRRILTPILCGSASLDSFRTMRRPPFFLLASA
jgi:hypothetical protein